MRTNRRGTHHPSVSTGLVVFSDTHCGDKLGLCPPDPVLLDDGGTYAPSTFQRSTYEYFREFHEEWIPAVARGEPWDLCLNGDAIDGTHHGSTHQISHNIEDQLRIAEAVLLPFVEQCRASGGTYYHIRGTEAHVGQSGVYEEMLARRLGAKPNDHGQYARHELWKRVGKALVHVLHHVGTTSSSAHESSAVNAEMSAEYGEAARWGREIPDFIVRSHRHRCIVVELDTYKGYGYGVVTPGWQGKTPWTYKIPGARVAEPQFGGIILRQGDEEHYLRRFVRGIERSAEE